MKSKSNKIDRRRFLVGSGGAVLALPMLQEFLPRNASAQGMTPPKRLVMFAHEHGRNFGSGKMDNGVMQEFWSPSATTGNLPANGTAASRLLAPLAAINSEIVTIDGIDNVLRHASGEADGHYAAKRSGFTGRLPVSTNQAGGASFDYLAGLRLRANDAMRPSLLIPASATPVGYDFKDLRFWGANGSSPSATSGNPRVATTDIFGTGNPAPSNPDPNPTPTAPANLAERLQRGRKSILDNVLGELNGLSQRVNAADRRRLDQHAEFIRAIETRMEGSGSGVVRGNACERPGSDGVPNVTPATWSEYQAQGRNPAWERGAQDNVTVPFQIENLVQGLACDISRSAVLTFWSDPTFAYAFDGTSPFAGTDSWHQTIHGMARVRDANTGTADQLDVAFASLGVFFTQLVQRLGEIEDIDGSRLLDNTLVMWVSELGYGSEHTVFNIPVVLAGMGDAFEKGRHVVENRRTTGDLFAHALRILGQDDQTFGETGTLGEVAGARGFTELFPEYGAPGYINADTPLHGGPLSI